MSVRVLPVVLSFAVAAAACGSGGSGPTPVTSTTSISTTTTSVIPPPQPGVWTATAGFGTFDMTVNADSAAIGQIAYHFSSWRCGNATYSGGVTVISPSGWPITSRQFSIQNSFTSSMGLSITIQGTFSTATSASGSWTANSSGTACSGTWTSSR